MTVTRPTPSSGKFYMNDSYIVTIEGTAPTSTTNYWAKYQIVVRLGDGTIYESQVYMVKGGIPVNLDLINWARQFLRAQIPTDAPGALNENRGWASIGLRTGENELDKESCDIVVGSMTDEWSAASEEVVLFEGVRQIDNIKDVNNPQLTFSGRCIHAPIDGYGVVSGWNMGGQVSQIEFLDKDGDVISSTSLGHPHQKFSAMLSLANTAAPLGTKMIRINWAHGLGSTVIKYSNCINVEEVVFYDSLGGWSSMAFENAEVDISKVSDLIELETNEPRAYNRRAINKGAERQITWKSIGKYTKEDRAYLEAFASSFRYLLRVRQGSTDLWVPIEFNAGDMKIFVSDNTLDLQVTANLILEV